MEENSRIQVANACMVEGISHFPIVIFFACNELNRWWCVKPMWLVRLGLGGTIRVECDWIMELG
jgi:hypothetical protein